MRKKKFCSILVKIRAAFLLLFAVFLLILAYILGVQYKERSVADMKQQFAYEDELLSQSLETKIQSTNSSVNMIIIHLNEVMPSSGWLESGGPHINTETQRLIYQCMIDTFTTFHDAEQIMIVWNNGVTWYENWTENYSMQRGGEELLQEMEAVGADKNGSWLTAVSADSQIGGTGCYYAKEYVDIETGQSLGYVVLKVRDILESADRKDLEREIYLFDKSGNLVQTSSEEILAQRDQYREEEDRLAYSAGLKEEILNRKLGSRQIVNCVSFGSGWEMISVTDISRNMEVLNQSILLILLACLSLMAVIWIVTFRMIRRILHPIQKLSVHMDESRGQLPIPIDMPVQNDETGVLITHFNEMADRNSELVDMLLEEKKEQEQLKLSLLQSQIKPHFLYNTLDTIYCLVIMGKNEEGSRMTKLLSMYYRHVLSSGMDWVLLSEEVQQTKNYLQIQKIRYRDRLEYSIQMEPDVENIKIPKLTLQPLVENAIYHGIKPSGRKGCVAVEISQNQDTVCIRVRDDGVGFPPEKFRKCIEENQCTEGYGLKNVVDRLGIYYKDRCRVSLEECGAGTCILIELKV